MPCAVRWDGEDHGSFPPHRSTPSNSGLSGMGGFFCLYGPPAQPRATRPGAITRGLSPFPPSPLSRRAVMPPRGATERVSRDRDTHRSRGPETVHRATEIGSAISVRRAAATAGNTEERLRATAPRWLGGGHRCNPPESWHTYSGHPICYTGGQLEPIGSRP